MPLNPAGPLNDAFDAAYGLNAIVGNRFDDFKFDFDYNNMNDVLKSIYGNQTNLITRKANKSIDDANKSAISRLASSGITDGAILEDTIAGNTYDIGESLFDSLESLTTSQASDTIDLMNQENQNKYLTTKAAQDVDFQNITNQINKIRTLLSSASVLENKKLAAGNQTGIWDDILSTIQSGSNVASLFV
ncbi:MAG: hypothetical protein PVH88_02175 [Ignavibacteria bacterium]|jgi:hypothetical protein